MNNPLSAIWQPSITTQPPTPAETHRNDLLLLLFVAVLLLCGLVVRNLAIEPARTVTLGDGLPTIPYPAGWVALPTSESLLFAARNATSPSALDSEIRVQAQPVREGESLETLRVMTTFRRNQELDRYRELDAQRVLVQGTEPGYLVTYAYIADPTLDSGAPGLPVVAEAQDLIFGSGNQWLTVTTLADASIFEDERAPFAELHSALNVQPAVLVPPTATPVESVP